MKATTEQLCQSTRLHLVQEHTSPAAMVALNVKSAELHDGPRGPR